VAITLELYLEHQIIRGSFGRFKDDSSFRPIDLLNYVTGEIIELSDAWSASLHAEAPPVWLDTVRVKRTHILMVIAQDTSPLPPRQLRITFVEKRPFRAVLGLGPFAVAGTMYLNPQEQESLAALEHDSSGRFFVPVTEAQVRSQYHKRWTVEAQVIFVNHGAIGYTHTLAET
jgi:hypothetical protein